MKVLIADDDADIRGLVEFTLSKAGFEVCTADSGLTALQSFEGEAPDLIVLDVNMPGISGLEVCRTLRAANTRKPIRFTTGTTK